MNILLVVLLIMAIRLSSVFWVRTFFVPDEYWQSLEVAHRMVFGYGYLTWEWVQGLRSYVYPGIIAVVYKILMLLRLDSVSALIYLPRIMQALLSSYSDYRFFVWTGKKKWALFLMSVSWFWYYTCSRTLVNSLEMSLITIALSFFPFDVENTSYIWISAITCFLRPTAVVIWIPLIIYHLRHTRYSAMRLFWARFVLIGIIVLSVGVGIDSLLHGNFIVTPLEFLRYNVLHNVGTHYGTHPWYWYFSVGLPTMLGITFLVFLVGVIQTLRNREVYRVRYELLKTILISMVALSLIQHKEFRFLLSLLPLCMYICVDTMSRWSYKASRVVLWIVAIVILIGNAIPAYYLSTIHQRAPIEVMDKLQEISRDYRDDGNNRASIFFLMPCHSTPYYSHIHENVTLRILTCEPNLNNDDNYRDEADEFFIAPAKWLRSHVPIYPLHALPSHLVFYEPLGYKITEFLKNYQKIHHSNEAELHADALFKTIENNLGVLQKYQHINLAEIVQQLRNRNIVIYQRLTEKRENFFNIESKQTNEDDILSNDHDITHSGDANENMFN